MKKNPFVPTPAYPQPQQPPLPPGPPPPGQPQHPEYTAYWAAQSYNPQQQHQQWAAPQPSSQPAPVPPPPPPTAEQSALYANYGYGGQAALHWQQQRPRPAQPSPQMQQQAMQFHPHVTSALTPTYPYPPPITGYYGASTTGPLYPAQPMQTHATLQFYPVPPQQPSQPSMQVHHGPQQPLMQAMHPQTPQRHNHGLFHTPPHPHQLPPAKRQRFDGPSAPGPIRGGAPSQQSPSQGMAGSAGGTVPRGGIPARGISRGGSMNAISGGRGRGNAHGPNSSRGGSGGGGRGRAGGGVSMNFNGNNNHSSHDRSRGGSAPLKGHGSRGNFNNRRGGGSSASFIGPMVGSNAAGAGPFRSRGSRNGGRMQTDGFGTRGGDNSSSFNSFNKKDENRRTLTDFKIIGLEITELAWSWGMLPCKPEIIDEVPTRESTPVPLQNSNASQSKSKDESSHTLSIEPTQILTDEIETQPTEDYMTESQVDTTSKIEKHIEVTTSTPPSRVRIYFHTPVSADDARYVPGSHNIVPSSPMLGGDGRKGKRKKIEDDDEDNDIGRAKRLATAITPSVVTDDNPTTSEIEWSMPSGVPDDFSSTADDDGASVAAPDIDDASNVHDEEEEDATETAFSPLVEISVEIHGNDPDERVSVSDENHVKQASNLDGAEASEMSGDAVRMTLSAVHHAQVIESSDAQAQPNDFPSNASLTPTLSIHDDVDDAASVSAILQIVEASEMLVAEADTSTPQAPSSPVSGTEGLSTGPLTLLPPTEHVQGLSQIESDLPELAGVTGTLFDGDHLPEPPASPNSHTLLSTSSGSTCGGDNTQSSPTSPVKQDELVLERVPVPSANRISISYAGSTRRLVIDADVVERLTVYRDEGHIEVKFKVQKVDDRFYKGIFVEGLDENNKSYLTLDMCAGTSLVDATIPAFEATVANEVILRLYLDKEKPLSEPKWVKSGDVQEWLRSILGRMFWAAGNIADSWERKIEVADPDPPPTILTVLDAWIANSPAGLQVERQRFHKTHLTVDPDNILEILLRLVRGERAAPFSSTPSATNVSAGPLIAAITPGSAHGSQQSHVSLAVLAIVQMAREYAVKNDAELGKKQVEDRIGELIRCLPQHLVYKSLDGMFKEWKIDKKGAS